MKSSLFRRQLLMTVGIMLICVVIGVIATFLVNESEHQNMESMMSVPPAKMFDELVTTYHHSPEEALNIVRMSGGRMRHLNVTLMDRIAFQHEYNLRDEELPQSPYEIGQKRNRRIGPPEATGIQLKSMPDQLLVFSFDKGGPPPPPPRMFLVNTLALIISVIMGSVLSLLLFFYSMRGKADSVRAVLNKMKQGDLKARMPMGRLDEIGRLMQEFNHMADEIERLVERLKTTEQSRMALLQELAHDLRTPVASLKTLLETLHLRRAKLTDELRDELTALSLRETEYFERLIEDLLFIAQVNEPKYHPEKAEINALELLEEEMSRLNTRYGASGKRIQLQTTQPIALVRGDAHLLRRLFRNALENAHSFAQAQVHVQTRVRDNQIEIEVLDDGPGFTAEALNGFGVKRVTRMLDAQQGERLSVGLGSVIMKAVAELHDGAVVAQNSVRTDGTVRGGVVTLTLPMAHV